MKRVRVFFLVLLMGTLLACDFSSMQNPFSSQDPVISQEPTAVWLTRTPGPTNTIGPTAAPPYLREGYPVLVSDYTNTGLTDSEFDRLWVGGFQDYYHKLAEAKLGENPVPVTFEFAGNNAIKIISNDGRSIVVLASYTTIRTDKKTRYEEYWRIIAFKSYDSIRVLRCFVGEIPNISGSAAADVRRQTFDLSNRKGVIRHMLLVLDAAGVIETTPDVIQVIGGQELKSARVVKDIVDSVGSNFPKEAESLLIYGLING